MASVRSRWLSRVAIAALIAVTLGWLPYQVYARSGLFRYWKLRAEYHRLHDENLRLHETNLKLRAELDELSDDAAGQTLSRAAIERAARDELGLVRPGEVVYSLAPIEEGRP